MLARAPALTRPQAPLLQGTKVNVVRGCAVGRHACTSSTASAAAASVSQEHKKTFHHGITYTSYEGNTFHVKFNTSGVRVLVDPWLHGDLEFFDQSWLYRGKKRGFRNGVTLDINEVAADTDVVLITQWVDDHTHMPTLTRFPKDVPIIAQPEAAERIKDLGFKSLTTISPGQTMELADGQVKLRATAGASVGPPWSARQNGYILTEQGVEEGASLYYEPHCDFVEASLQGLGPVDVVVSPVQSVLLGGYPLVKGDTELAKLLRILRPKVLVPLLNADLDEEGQLKPFMSVAGSNAQDKVEAMLRSQGIKVKVDYPAPPGESLAIAL